MDVKRMFKQKWISREGEWNFLCAREKSEGQENEFRWRLNENSFHLLLTSFNWHLNRFEYAQWNVEDISIKWVNNIVVRELESTKSGPKVIYIGIVKNICIK